jgi:hydrogenase maturation protease
MKTLVLGLGNPILTDDGVGIHVVRAAARRRPPKKNVTFAEASVGGLRLLDPLLGYSRLILVDAIQTRGGEPGAIYRLGPGDVQATFHSGSTHDLSLAAALDLGRRLGLHLPGDDALTILAVEVKDVLTFGETCTAAVTEAIPRAVDAVLAELRDNPPVSAIIPEEKNVLPLP